MKRIAIIAPCILPVPATSGGAVEGLVSKIIEDNEKYRDYIIDLFTIDCDKNYGYSFSYTNFIYVKSNFFINATDRIIDKYYRTVHADSSLRVLDFTILKEFICRISVASSEYDAVIVENMISTACTITHFCNGKYTFPIFFHMHNDVDMYRSPQQIKDLVCYGVRFIAVSGFIKARINQIDNKANVNVLYNGIDFSRYQKSERSISNKTTIYYIGRIIPEKGVKELVYAFVNACESLSGDDKENLELKIVGFSGLNHKYEKLIRDLCDDYSNIECLSHISCSEMPSLYNSADLVIIPSVVDESFCLVALESMAKGIPLIATDSGAVPEVVGNGACIVSKEDNIVENLKGAILKIFYDHDYRKDIASRGFIRAHSHEQFDINNYYKYFNKIVEPLDISSEDTISLIVPVYNVSNYLRRCVLSLINQTYKNIEIILIDDGSTDGSDNICDELATYDNRIKVIHQDNKGLSVARNIGLDNVTGSCIFFCDSDDYLMPETLEKMLTRLKRDCADVVACGIANVYDFEEDDKKKKEIITSSIPGMWSGRESVVQMMRYNNVCSVTWNKLYKRELFDQIRFPEGVNNEDEAVTYKLLYKAGIVSYTPDVFYMYYQRPSSIMHHELETRFRFFIDALKERIKYFNDLGETELEQHSRISLLEWIKYSYRNIKDKKTKQELLEIYNDNVSFDNVPSVMGIKKMLALLLWKYFRY